MRRVYLDHAASAPLRPQAREALLEASALPGNPSSIHAEGRAARTRLEAARRIVASHMGLQAGGVVFTSGGTEANVLALHQARAAGRAALVSGVAHASALAGEGVETLPVDARGQTDLDWLERRLNASPQVGVVSLLCVNNETGIIDATLDEALALCRRAGALLHVDAVQALGWIDPPWRDEPPDMVSVSAHKLGGPKGIGALVVRPDLEVRPLIAGGGQESRRRGGTQAVALAAGFAAALEANMEALDAARVADLGADLVRLLARRCPQAVAVADRLGVARSARILAPTLPGVPAMTQVMALDLEGFAVSAGSACTSGKVETSHVLAAMGLSPEEAACTIRVSLGWSTTPEEVDRFTRAYGRLADRLRGG